MSLIADMIAADLGDVDPHKMTEHLRAVAALTPRQLSGMLGWTQQEQDPGYEVAYALLRHREDDRTITVAQDDLEERLAALETDVRVANEAVDNFEERITRLEARDGEDEAEPGIRIA